MCVPKRYFSTDPPLTHTIALKELAQNVVGNPNEAECGLKYVIHIPESIKSIEKRSRSSAVFFEKWIATRDAICGVACITTVASPFYRIYQYAQL